MRRRRGNGLVGCGRAAPARVVVVLAGAQAAPTTATRPGGRRRRVRVRVRLRGRVREASGAVAIELQGGGVAAADLRREVTVVVSGIDGLARRGRGRRLVLGVQRVHEVRTHRGDGGGGPGRTRAALSGRAARSRQGARLSAAGLPQGPLGQLLAPLEPPGYVAAAARPRVASEARQPRALGYWALMPGSGPRRLGLAPPPCGSRGLTQPPRSPPARPLPARAGLAAI